MTDSTVELKSQLCLNGKYIIQHTLGVGGFGITYKAWDNTLQTEVYGSKTKLRCEGTVSTGNRNENDGWNERSGCFNR